jgi:hypothetical protein
VLVAGRVLRELLRILGNNSSIKSFNKCLLVKIAGIYFAAYAGNIFYLKEIF